MSSDFELIKKINYGYASEADLIEIYYKNKDNHRILLNLAQNPKFPEKFSIDILMDLVPVDLVRIIKNKRTRPAVRKRAELEFFNRYNRLHLGEKISLLKMAPFSLLTYFVEEKNKKVLKAMLENVYCTEELVLRMINRKTSRFNFYEVLRSTEWPKRPLVIEAILNDNQAPIRIILDILPLLSKTKLRKIYQQKQTHQIVKNHIFRYIKQNDSH